MAFWGGGQEESTHGWLFRGLFVGKGGIGWLIVGFICGKGREGLDFSLSPGGGF